MKLQRIIFNKHRSSRLNIKQLDQKDNLLSKKILGNNYFCNSEISSINKLIYYSVLSVLFNISCVSGCNKHNGDFHENDNKLEQHTEDCSKSASPDQLINIIESSDGAIYEKSILNDNGTVIYIADHHKNISKPTKEQYMTQKQIFSIVKNVVEKGEFGFSVPLVIESWETGVSRDDFFSKLKKNHLLYNLYSTENNEYEANKALNSTTSNASAILPGFFKTELYPIGTVSKTEQKDINDFLLDAKLLSQIKNNMEFCELDDGSKLSISTVSNLFHAHPNQKINECYCSIHYLESKIIDRLNYRLLTIPKREAHFAINALKQHDKNKNSISILIAGIKHMNLIVDTLKKENTNYITVFPNELNKNYYQLLNSSFHSTFLDDDLNTCKELIENQQEQVLSTIHSVK